MRALDMLFVRDFAQMQGGHLKFAHYLDHIRSSGLAEPRLYQTPRSRSVPGNIFARFGDIALDALRPFPAYFVAGGDWFILDAAGIDPAGAPTINLIQDFQYAEPGHPLHACLARPALRICVSTALAEALAGHANGPVHAIENGVDLPDIPDRRSLDAPPRFVVAGLKDQGLARDVAVRLDPRCEIDLILEPLPRADFLARLAAASVCILLPQPIEGFFLPPLEAMALGRGVVTVDCVGNRVYCRPGDNCLMPARSAEAVSAAAMDLARDPAALVRIAAAGLGTAERHSLDRERAAVHALLTDFLARVACRRSS